MKLLLGMFLGLGFGIPCAWAAISDGTSSGHAEYVTINSIEDGDGLVILTFSGPLSDGPACAAQHRDALVIGNGIDSPDAEKARHAYKLAQVLKVAGGGNCKRVSGYETLSSIEPMQ
jgi:hypothetical protein